MLCWLLPFFLFDNLREKRSVPLTRGQVSRVLGSLAARRLKVTVTDSIIITSIQTIVVPGLAVELEGRNLVFIITLWPRDREQGRRRKSTSLVLRQACPTEQMTAIDKSERNAGGVISSELRTEVLGSCEGSALQLWEGNRVQPGPPSRGICSGVQNSGCPGKY